MVARRILEAELRQRPGARSSRWCAPPSARPPRRARCRCACTPRTRRWPAPSWPRARPRRHGRGRGRGGAGPHACSAATAWWTPTSARWTAGSRTRFDELRRAVGRGRGGVVSLVRLETRWREPWPRPTACRSPARWCGPPASCSRPRCRACRWAPPARSAPPTAPRCWPRWWGSSGRPPASCRSPTSTAWARAAPSSRAPPATASAVGDGLLGRVVDASLHAHGRRAGAAPALARAPARHAAGGHGAAARHAAARPGHPLHRRLPHRG